MGNNILCYTKNIDDQYGKNGKSINFSFQINLIHKQLCLQTSKKIIQYNQEEQKFDNTNQEQSIIQKIAVLHPSLPRSLSFFSFKIKNSLNVKVGVCQRSIIESVNFEYKNDYESGINSGFYGIDGQGFYYKPNQSPQKSFFQFKGEYLIIGCRWEHKKGVLSWKVIKDKNIENDDKLSSMNQSSLVSYQNGKIQNQSSNETPKQYVKSHVFKMEVLQQTFSFTEFNPCIILGDQDNEIEVYEDDVFEDDYY